MERKRKVRELDSSYIRQYEQVSDEKIRKQKGLIRRLTALFLIGAVVGTMITMAIHTQVKALEEKEEQKQELQAKLKELEDEQSFLEQEVINYNDLEYIAEVARRDYFLSKEGETLFKLPNASSD
ncbi:FtsB family cell division protein [Bacillus alkalicellulosilyticus]|uniref:FtsB family cell division protein n=1 Tax=Alkalihalobacterium alkalicellulosilyticum TaxID=1912214 RepID=UPI0009972C35|nr:septum formation initiator family protein [Bacillus alkalicellulosilyticus]